jgi:hypothetical protein
MKYAANIIDSLNNATPSAVWIVGIVAVAVVAIVWIIMDNI